MALQWAREREGRNTVIGQLNGGRQRHSNKHVLRMSDKDLSSLWEGNTNENNYQSLGTHPGPVTTPGAFLVSHT